MANPSKLSPPAIVREDVDLKSIAVEINSAHSAMESCSRQTLEHAQAAGEALVRAKKAIGHGNWLAWIKANVRVTVRQSQRYMRLAEEAAKSDIMSHLTDGLRILTEDEDESEDGTGTKVKRRSPKDSAATAGQTLFCRPCRVGVPKLGCKDCAALRTQQAAEAYPARIRPFFESVPDFEKASKRTVPLANLLQEIEATPAYRKAVEGRKYTDYSSYVRLAGQFIESVTPVQPCPECGGAEEPSPENDTCAKCGGKGYLTFEEVEG